MVTNSPPGIVERLRAQRKQSATGDVFDPDCPTRLVLDRLGDKWTTLIVLLLSDGPMRFSQLRAHLGPVAPKVLTQTLRRMERDGLVTREIFAEVPPRVDYTLTVLGHSLVGPISVVADWAEVHLRQITGAQEAYDAALERHQARR